MSSLKKGLLWSAIDRFSVIGIQIIIEIILARIIDPKNYGLIGLASIFIVFGSVLLDSGFSKAIIQKIDRTKKDFATMFYLNLILSIVVYSIIFFSANYIGDYFTEPQLPLVIKILCLNLIITGFTLVQRTKLEIELNFKKQASISLTSVIISGIVSITLAYNGFGVWALVFQSILMNVISLVQYFYYNPIFYSFRDVSKKSFNHMFKFGGHLTLSALIQAIYQNSFSFLIGKNISATALGIYNKSNQFTLMPISVLTNVVNRVTYPEFSKCQNDNEFLQNAHLRFLKYFSYFIFPIFFSFAAISNEFVVLFLGEKWLEAVDIIKLLCFAYVLYPFTVMNMTLFQIKNKTSLFFRIDLISKILSFIFLCFLIRYGIKGVCYTIIISQILQFIISIAFSSKLLQSGFFVFFKGIFFSLIYFFVFYLIIGQVNSWIEDSIVKILVALFISLLSIILLLFKDKHIFKELKRLM